ncbi:neuronal pentraxin receptor [Amia ocellicauda]|uniref:neuronal pentraxin receptor n=1 Tax=Amia ocellicauda TaxID=2972642 RepID=UPI0034645D91
MLAFLGAVICIIASVHPGSGRAASQTPVDNESLSPATGMQPIPPGSVAEAGSLGALHGSGTEEGGGGGGRGLGLGLGLGLGIESPTFNGLSGGQQFSFSRMVCTPIPAGECKMKPPGKTKLQQADDPSLYAGEDWGFLRTAAEELRQTVMQQKQQIRSDQDTIRELTGKLSECESGLEERSLPAALLGSRQYTERSMSGDDAPASAVQLHSARAVEELEQAIHQLKDRIEKLESELGARPNNSGSGQPGPGTPWLQADSLQWRVEDLEGELRRRMEQLDKERAALRKETGRQRLEIDQDINNLHHRIAQLEQGLSDYNYPEGYKLLFPSRTNSMHAVVRQAVPELYSMTACLWLRPRGGDVGTPFSYSVPGQPNELVLLQGPHSPVELLINDKVAQLPLQLSGDVWQHVCVSWTLRDGAWWAYQDGQLRGQGENLAAWHPIRPGGVLILGQEQDTLGGRFDATQALVGELAQFNMWDRLLSPSEVGGLASCSHSLAGSVVSWSDRHIDVFGGASKEPLEPCQERRRGEGQ